MRDQRTCSRSKTGTRTPVTNDNDERLRRASALSRRLLAVLVGLLATLGLVVSGAAPASAQNAVGPQPVHSILAVGPYQAAGQENVGVRGSPLRQTASATGVAADTDAGELATCGGGSFSPDTQVVMADGSTKPLNEIKVGDKVQATDPKTGKTTAQSVTTLWVNHDTDLMNVTVKSGGKTSTVQATQHHLFWDATRKAWVDADHLVAGDQLRTDDGSLATVAGTIVVSGAADMWDLTVNNAHDFYVVTSLANVLVHNCGTGHADIHQYPGIQANRSQFFDGVDLNDLASSVTGRGESLQGGSTLNTSSLGPKMSGSTELQAFQQTSTQSSNPVRPGNHHVSGNHEVRVMGCPFG